MFFIFQTKNVSRILAYELFFAIYVNLTKKLKNIYFFHMRDLQLIK